MMDRVLRSNRYLYTNLKRKKPICWISIQYKIFYQWAFIFYWIIKFSPQVYKSLEIPESHAKNAKFTSKSKSVCDTLRYELLWGKKAYRQTTCDKNNKTIFERYVMIEKVDKSDIRDNLALLSRQWSKPRMHGMHGCFWNCRRYN